MRLTLKTKILEILGSSAKLARLCGESDDWISRIVHERRDPTPDEKKKICKLLNVPQSKAKNLFKSMAN